MRHALWPPLLSACARPTRWVLFCQPPLWCLWIVNPLQLLHLPLLELHLCLRLPLLKIGSKILGLTCVI